MTQSSSQVALRQCMVGKEASKKSGWNTKVHNYFYSTATTACMAAILLCLH